ncbi:MAG TPA: hypothetical protein VJU84_06590 [Pyrinomonadaceae bacterium]|nr:hypothetical protein [Pyrinomonadaceae bacterium]
MKKVVSIFRGRFLSTYCAAQRKQRIPDLAWFLMGILLLIVLPAIAYYLSGGPVHPMALFAGALAGFIWGVIKYRKSPYEVLSCIDKDSRAPLPANANQKPPARRISK